MEQTNQETNQETNLNTNLMSPEAHQELTLALAKLVGDELNHREEEARNNFIKKSMTNSLDRHQEAGTLPDFQDAVNYLGSKHDEEMRKHPDAENISPAQMRESLDNIHRQIIEASINAGVDPAEAIYNFAIKQGFAKEQAKEQAKEALENNQEDTQDKVNFVDAVKASQSPKGSGTSSVNGFDVNAFKEAMKNRDFNKASNLI